MLCYSPSDNLCQYFEARIIEFLDLSNFNTKNVTDFDEAFCECRNLSNLDLTSFDFSNATTSDMFWGTKWEKEQPEAKLYTT